MQSFTFFFPPHFCIGMKQYFKKTHLFKEILINVEMWILNGNVMGINTPESRKSLCLMPLTFVKHTLIKWSAFVKCNKSCK